MQRPEKHNIQSNFFLCVRRGRRRNGVNTHFNKSQIGRPAAGPTVSKIKPVRIYKREGERGKEEKEKTKTSRRKRRKQEAVNEPESRASCCGIIDVRPHTLGGKTRFSFSVLCCSVEPKPILPSPYRAFFFLLSSRLNNARTKTIVVTVRLTRWSERTTI